MIQRTRAQRIFEKMFRHTACTLQRLTRVFAWMILRRWDEGTNKYLVDHCWLNFLGLVDLWLTKKNNNKNTSAVCGFNRSVDMYSTAVQPAWTVRAFSNYFPRDLTTGLVVRDSSTTIRRVQEGMRTWEPFSRISWSCTIVSCPPLCVCVFLHIHDAYPSTSSAPTSPSFWCIIQALWPQNHARHRCVV